MSKYDGDGDILATLDILSAELLGSWCGIFFPKTDIKLQFMRRFFIVSQWRRDIFSIFSRRDIWFLPASNSNVSAYLVRTSKYGLKIIEEEEENAA